MCLALALAAFGQQGASPAYAAGHRAGAADAHASLPPNARKFEAYVHGDAAYRGDFAAGYADGYRQPAAAPAEVPEGTSITTVVDQPLDVMSVREGFPLNLEVATPVEIQGVVAVPAGAWVRGYIGAVVRATPRRGTSSMVLALEQLELPGRPPVRLVAHVESVAVGNTHVHPEHSQVTGIEYGPRYGLLVGGAIGAGLGVAVGRGARGRFAGGLLGGLLGAGLAAQISEMTPHDPNLILPIGARILIRTDQSVPLGN